MALSARQKEILNLLIDYLPELRKGQISPADGGDILLGDAIVAANALSILVGYVSGAGAISPADTVLSAIQKLNGNDLLRSLKPSAITALGVLTPATDQTSTNVNIAAIQAKLDALIAALNT
jgi:hypothetical protein